jgi:TRAP-type mannitol/chloroaromatic compound transport system permease small subunit
MTLATFAIVVLRYGFDLGAIALQESVLYLHATAFMLSIPWTLKIDGHVRVDVIYGRLSESGQAWVNLLGHCLFLGPVAITLFWLSLPYVSASWRILEGSPEVGGIPAIFLLKTLIPLMCALLFLQGIAGVIRACRAIRWGSAP